MSTVKPVAGEFWEHALPETGQKALKSPEVSVTLSPIER